MSETEKLAKQFSVYDYAHKMLKEIEFHATSDNCSRCQKLIHEMYLEIQKNKGDV
jgi:hypothetical protein